EPRHRRRRGAGLPGEAGGGRALSHLRRGAAGQDRRVREKRTRSDAYPLGGVMDETGNPLPAGLEGERVPPPTTLVIFGASGDLTKRKLLPALYSLARDRLLPSTFNVVGVARRDLADGVFRQSMREACDKWARRRPVEESLWESFGAGIFYVSGT